MTRLELAASTTPRQTNALRTQKNAFLNREKIYIIPFKRKKRSATRQTTADDTKREGVFVKRALLRGGDFFRISGKNTTVPRPTCLAAVEGMTLFTNASSRPRLTRRGGTKGLCPPRVRGGDASPASPAFPHVLEGVEDTAVCSSSESPAR